MDNAHIGDKIKNIWYNDESIVVQYVNDDNGNDDGNSTEEDVNDRDDDSDPDFDDENEIIIWN